MREEEKEACATFGFTENPIIYLISFFVYRRDENKVSRLTFYFKDDLFKTLRREEAFYTAEFILEFGGLHILVLGVVLLLFMWWIVHLVERKQRNVVN